MKKSRMRYSTLLSLPLLTLSMCTDSSTGKSDASCPCLAEKSAVAADSLAGVLKAIIRGGASNGSPANFTRSCDSIQYTYTVWIGIGGMPTLDSSLSINHIPVQVRINRSGNDLFYSAETDANVQASDTVLRWFDRFGVGDSATCLPNVENVIVDSIDGRLLTSLDIPSWNLKSEVTGLASSCDSLAATVTLSDSTHAQTLEFHILGKVTGNRMNVTGTIGPQTFTLVPFAPWCGSLGMQ